jgi:tripartite-type tricarboxylate transporter receptor subunit TctC
MIQAGKLRAVAVTSNARAAALPAVSTVAQAGVPGYEFNTWHGMFAPAATPKAVIARLNSELRKIQGSAEVKSRYTSQGLEAVSTTPEEFGAMMKRELDKWGAVVRAAKVQME